MVRYRKGTKLKKEDLWTEAGGRDRVITELLSLNITRANTRWNSDVWAKLSVRLFGIADVSYKKWLNIVWQQNRRGVRTAVNANWSDSQKNANADRQINVESKMATDPPLKKNQDVIDFHVDNHTASVDEEDHNGEADDHLIDNAPLSRSLHDLQDEGVMRNADVEPADHLIDNGKLSIDFQNPQEEEVKENAAESDGQVPMDFHDDSQWDCVESKNDTEVDKNESRIIKPGPRKFKIKIPKKTWGNIKPKKGSTKLKRPWTNIIYKQFRKYNPCCTLVFKYHHVKMQDSRKRSCPYLMIKAVCSFSTCRAIYLFKMPKKPSNTAKSVSIQVTRFGKVKHLKGEIHFRPAN